MQLQRPDAQQLVILSGKGGAGKTSVCAAFAHLASRDTDTQAVLVDADVEASNLELVLAPHIVETHDFVGGQIARIDPTLCAGCGTCMDVCRFGAVREDGAVYAIDRAMCEGCAACMTQCPEQAIRMEPQLAGRWFRSESRYGPLFHAALSPGAENSGKLVTLIKRQANQMARQEGQPLLIVDGPPGIGCPAIAACSNADLVVIVTEPTVSGIQDMQRIVETVQHFGSPLLVVINKADLYAEGQAQIEEYCRNNDLTIAARIPFDTIVVEAMIQALPITAYQPESPVSRALVEVWEKALVFLYERV